MEACSRRKGVRPVGERIDWQLGDIARLRKPHACGGYDWQVQRMGMEVRLVCQTCGREVRLSRQDFEKRVKARLG